MPQPRKKERRRQHPKKVKKKKKWGEILVHCPGKVKAKKKKKKKKKGATRWKFCLLISNFFLSNFLSILGIKLFGEFKEKTPELHYFFCSPKHTHKVEREKRVI